MADIASSVTFSDGDVLTFSPAPQPPIHIQQESLSDCRWVLSCSPRLPNPLSIDGGKTYSVIMTSHCMQHTHTHAQVLNSHSKLHWLTIDQRYIPNFFSPPPNPLSQRNADMLYLQHDKDWSRHREHSLVCVRMCVYGCLCV